MINNDSQYSSPWGQNGTFVHILLCITAKLYNFYSKGIIHSMKITIQ